MKTIVFHVFIRTGKGKTARDSSGFSTVADNYAAAVRKFAAHWNECSFSSKFGANWRPAKISTKGMPALARAFKDEKGNKLILVPA